MFSTASVKPKQIQDCNVKKNWKSLLSCSNHPRPLPDSLHSRKRAKYVLTAIKTMSRKNSFRHTADSASRHSLSMAPTHSTGYLPLAVSPDNMTQSAPSITALATSEHSALVARGLFVIDSNICVAQIPGLPFWMAND